MFSDGVRDPPGESSGDETLPPHLRRGRLGEDAALAAYQATGYQLVARNWTSKLGELDLVLRRGHLLVFCEVKTRGGSEFGGPHEAVTWRKRQKLRALAEVFLAAEHGAPARLAHEVRFDVASVMVDRAGRASVHLFEGAF